MSVFSPKVKAKLKAARENRITVQSVMKDADRSRIAIIGYKKGYEVTQEALNHSYNANLGHKV